MQKLYLCIFNLIYKVTGNINSNLREAVIFLSCLVLMWSFFFSNYYKGSGEYQIAGSVIVTVIIAFSIDRELKPIKWNSYCYYPLLLFGIGILLIGLMHPVGDGYMMYALDIAILFPGLYFVWSNREDHERLFCILSAAITLFGLISFAKCVLLAAKGELAFSSDRVQGFTTNPNYLGMLGVVILISGLFLLITEIKNIACLALASICVGIGISFAIISVSRTAMLSEIICVLAFSIFYIKIGNIKCIKSKSKWFRVALAAVLIGSILVLGMSLDDINYHALSKINASETEANTIESEVVQPEASEAEKITERVGAEGDANTISSGRITIWKIYAEEFSLWGKPLSVIKPQLKNAAESRAHNNVVDYLYRCGYVVGSIYFIYYIMQGIAGLKLLFSKKYTQPSHLFAIMMIGAYSIYATLEICTLAFIRIIPCVYFLSIAPIFVDERGSLSQKG